MRVRLDFCVRIGFCPRFAKASGFWVVARFHRLAGSA